MEYEKHLSVGQKLNLEIISSYYREDKTYKSQVLEIKEGNSFLIAIPISDGKIVPIPIGTEIKLYFNMESKGVYSLRAKIKDRTTEPIPYFEVQQISEAFKIQRRDYFRFHTAIEINLYNESNEFVIEGYTKDISGGGMRFVSHTKFKSQDILHIKFKINDKFQVYKTKVIRSTLSDPVVEQYETAVEFFEIDESDRNSLVKYIFEQQRKLRQKGLM